MNLKSTRNEVSDTVQYQLGDISISTVKELKELMIKELTGNSKVELDLSNVDKFDTAGLQLILYLKREAGRNKKEIVISSKGMNVSRVFELYGVSA